MTAADEQQGSVERLARHMTIGVSMSSDVNNLPMESIIDQAVAKATGRRRRVRVLQGVSAAVVTAAAGSAALMGWVGTENVATTTRDLPPAQQVEGEALETYTLPSLEPSIDLEATPSGDVPKKWREQIQESTSRYPGVFALPDSLPVDISLMYATTFSGHPVIDVVPVADPGVIICADELDVCQTGLEGWPVIRSTSIEGTPVQIIGKPAEVVGGQHANSQETVAYWQSAALTFQSPDWLSSSVRN